MSETELTLVQVEIGNSKNGYTVQSKSKHSEMEKWQLSFVIVVMLFSPHTLLFAVSIALNYQKMHERKIPQSRVQIF